MVRAFSTGNDSRSGEQGTSMAESLVALTIMTVGILGFFTFHVRASQSLASSLTMVQATHVASALQDSLRAVPFANGLPLDTTLEPCVSDTVDSLDDLCHVLAPVNELGINTDTGGPRFYPSYEVELLSTTQLLIRVRVRYESEDGRCPQCREPEFALGWKAVTLTSVRFMSAT